MSNKLNLTEEEQKKINTICDYLFFDQYTEDALRKENMANYCELQKIVAEIVNQLKLTIEEI